MWVGNVVGVRDVLGLSLPHAPPQDNLVPQAITG